MTTWGNLTKNITVWGEIDKSREEHFLLREQGDQILREDSTNILIEDIRTSWGNLTKNITSWVNLTKN